MSSFYITLPYASKMEFKKRKQKFKLNKRNCNICKKRLNTQRDKVVDHIIPVSQISDYEALYNQNNWQVICFNCKLVKDKEDQQNY